MKKISNFTILKKYLFIFSILFMFSACDFFESPPVAEFTHKAEIELAVVNGERLNSHTTGLNFGTITYGSTKRITVEIENTWDRSLELFSIKIKNGSENFSIDKKNTSTIVHGFNTTTIDVVFQPIKPGVVDGQLEITSNSETNNVYILPLRGCTEPAPVAIITQNNTQYKSDSTYWFNSTYINTPNIVTFELRNSGNAKLKIKNMFIENNSSFNLSLDDTNFNIEPGELTTFTIIFTPLFLDIEPALITLETNDTKCPRVKLYVDGRADEKPEPEISISYLSENQLSENQSELQYLNNNSIFQCDSSKEYYEFRIENRGDRVLEIDTIMLEWQDSFYIDKTNTKKELLPGEHTFLGVKFNPISNGESKSELEIISNSENNSKFTINLKGYADIEIGPQISVSCNNSVVANQSVVSFTDTYIGNVQTINFLLINNGDKNLQIDDVSFALVNESIFRLNSSNIIGSVIPPKSAKSFNVYFTPSLGIEYSTIVRVNSNSNGNNNFEFNLYGKGINKPKYTIYNKSALNTIIENNSCISRGYYSSTYGVYITEITIKNIGASDLIIEKIDLYDYYPDNSNYGDDPLLKLTGLSNSPDTVYLLLPGESTRFQIWTWNTEDTSYTSATKIKFQHADEFNFRFNR